MVLGNNIYFAGSYPANCFRGMCLSRACFWQGESRFDLELPDGTIEAAAESITNDDNTIFTAGSYTTQENESTACYWEGKNRFDLLKPEGTEACAKTITIFNSKAYTAGYYRIPNKISIACYWIGTERVDLEVPKKAGTASAVSIVVLN